MAAGGAAHPAREQPGIEITLASQSSPELAGALMRGKVDVAFLRREAQAPGLAFKFLIKEPLVAVLPADHRLPRAETIGPQDLAGETYITPTRVAPVLKAVIESYAAKSGITLKPAIRGRESVLGVSLVASTGGVTLLPLYVQTMLSPSVVIRPLQGEAPTIDLVLGYNRSNTSPLLKRFLSRAEELVAGVVQKPALTISRYIRIRRPRTSRDRMVPVVSDSHRLIFCLRHHRADITPS